MRKAAAESTSSSRLVALVREGQRVEDPCHQVVARVAAEPAAPAPVEPVAARVAAEPAVEEALAESNH